MAEVVLVHGAWHGPWAWQAVAALLGERGIATHAPALPSVGPPGAALGDLAADVSVVRATLDGLAAPAVVAGHSYGGVVVSAAAAGHERAGHLVFLTAFMLDAGESLLGLRDGRMPDWYEVSDDATLALVPERIHDVLFHDADPAAAGAAAARLGRQSLASFSDPVAEAAWRSVPSTYLVTTEDRAVPPRLQRRLAARAGERADLPCGHSAWLVRPDLVAEAIAERVARPAG